MKHEEIKKLEYSQERDNMKITFIKEGDWYRAYEWSAYLAHFYPNGLSDAERLHITHRKSSVMDGGLISVALKLAMFDKFLPGSERIINDGTVDVTVKKEMYPDIIGKTMVAIVTEWKAEIPITESKHQNNVPKILTRPNTFSCLMGEVMRYQLETHTPEESHAFVRKLKNMVADMVF